MTQKEDLEELLTTKDVARICKVSWRTVMRWIADKKLPVVRLDGNVRIRPQDLREFIDRNLKA